MDLTDHGWSCFTLNIASGRRWAGASVERAHRDQLQVGPSHRRYVDDVRGATSPASASPRDRPRSSWRRSRAPRRRWRSRRSSLGAASRG